MFDTATVTISGNVVADPRITGQPDDPDRVNFRVVSTRRRRDPVSGEWVDAGEYGTNVVCWRTLARGVARSLRRGDPVLVIGRITSREYQGDGGVRRWFTEVTADFIGHDLAKGTSSFIRFSRLSRLTEPTRPDGSSATPTAGDEEPADDGASAEQGEFDEESVDLLETELTGV